MLNACRIDDRLWDRVPVEMQVEVFPSTQTRALNAEALDISWNGARIRADRLALKLGEAVYVVLLGLHAWDRRLARVIWLENRGPGLEAGLEFVSAPYPGRS